MKLRSGHKRNVKALIRRIFEQNPDPVDLPLRAYGVHDRFAAREGILRKLRVRHDR